MQLAYSRRPVGGNAEALLEQKPLPGTCTYITSLISLPLKAPLQGFLIERIYCNQPCVPCWLARETLFLHVFTKEMTKGEFGADRQSTDNWQRAEGRRHIMLH